MKHIISIMDKKNPGKVVREVECETLEEVAEAATTECWSPSTFRDRHRLNANFTQTTLFVIDIDEGMTVEQAKDRFKDYNYFILGSRSHRKEKNGVTADRFRVILELESKITDEPTFRATWAELYKSYPEMDDQCKDPARMYYASPTPLHYNEVEMFGEVLVVNDDGTYSIAEAAIHDVSTEEKGQLSKATLEFIAFGAGPGLWHGSFHLAVKDLKEQGYTIEEAETLLSKATGVLDRTDQNQLKDIYSRPVKYEKREKENDIEETLPKTALGYFDEMISYITDKDKVKGEQSGIEGLDRLLGGGFRRGELTVMMAQAKTGKNTLYHYMMRDMLNRGKPQGYASRELDPASEVLPNLLTIELEKNLWTSEITDEDKIKMQEVLKSWPLHFSQGYGYFSIDKIKAWVESLVEQGVTSFWFDHFHYMLNKEDHDATTHLIKELKTMTKKHNIHINLIVQPKTIYGDEKIGFNSLRGGSAINQALDNLLILERYKNCDEPNMAVLRLEAARHKLAKTGKIYLQYLETTTSFREMQEELINHRNETPQGAGQVLSRYQTKGSALSGRKFPSINNRYKK